SLRSLLSLCGSVDSRGRLRFEQCLPSLRSNGPINHAQWMRRHIGSPSRRRVDSKISDIIEIAFDACDKAILSNVLEPCANVGAVDRDLLLGLGNLSHDVNLRDHDRDAAAVKLDELIHDAAVGILGRSLCDRNLAAQVAASQIIGNDGYGEWIDEEYVCRRLVEVCQRM